MAYSSEFLAEMKKRLEEEQKVLEKELRAIGKRVTSENFVAKFENLDEDGSRDSDVNAQEVTEYVNNLSSEAVLEKRYSRVLKALQRLEDGTYGICDGEPTSQARLEADPSAGALEHRDEMA